MQKYIFIVEKTNTGFSAYNEANGVYTVGEDMDELQDNIVEGLNLALEDRKEVAALEEVELKFEWNENNVVNS